MTRPAKPPRPPSRSRFQEGSMNDRVSAVPPVRFIGPDDHEPDGKQQQQFVYASIRAVPEEASPPPTDSHRQQQNHPQKDTTTTTTAQQQKRGSKQFLGQVWDGVRDVLRFRKDNNTTTTTTTTAEKRHSRPQDIPPPPPPQKQDDRPSRDEIYANYQNLVASGFFSSHAIQSTRQPRPSTAQPTSSSTYRTHTPPQWPLPPFPRGAAASATPPPASSPPVTSPPSSSSRGTKRAAMPPDADDDDDAALTNHRKLRKTASATRDISMPKLRSSSRLAARRSFSNMASAQREPNKLAKRVLGRFPMHVPERGSSSRRNVTESHAPSAARDDEGKVLRSRRTSFVSEPLRVRPDANRGIPSVPDIPPKFTYGEDRENNGPWRGLRRANV